MKSKKSDLKPKESKGSRKVFRILRAALLFFCGVIVTLIAFAWEINLGVSISYQTPITPDNPLLTYFTFINDSHFVLTNLHFDFIINGKGSNSTVTDCHYIYDIPGQLAQGHSVSKNAPLIGRIEGMNFNMRINISYTPKFLFIPLPPRQDSYSFQSVETVYGYWWIEQDIAK